MGIVSSNLTHYIFFTECTISDLVSSHRYFFRPIDDCWKIQCLPCLPLVNSYNEQHFAYAGSVIWKPEPYAAEHLVAIYWWPAAKGYRKDQHSIEHAIHQFISHPLSGRAMTAQRGGHSSKHLARHLLCVHRLLPGADRRGNA